MDLGAVAALPLCRRSVVELARKLPDPLPLSELAQQRDGPSFQLLALAAAQAQRPMPAQMLVSGASLLGDPLYLGVVMSHLEGDVAGAAVAAMEDGRMASPWVAAAMLFFAAVWCKQQKQPVPRGLAQWTRFVVRRGEDDDTLVTCVAIGHLLGDPHIAELLKGIEGPEWDELREETTSWLLGAFVGDAASVVPELPVALQRTGPKVGRNEACPCGSGKKYKRCCDGKTTAGKPIVRSAADLDALSAPDLLALDLSQLQPSVRLAAMWGLAQLGEVERVLNGQALLPDEMWQEMVASLVLSRLACGDVHGGRELADLLPKDRVPAELLVAEATPATSVKRLEKLALDGVDGNGVDAALAALVSPFPALGVLMARGVIGDPNVADDEALLVLEELHALRDARGWGPWDAASTWRQPAATSGRVAVDRDALEKVRLELVGQGAARREAEAAFDRAERERARLEGEAARAKTQALSASLVSVDAQELATLRAELQALKGIHKAVHDERNALRREVVDWRAQAEEEPVAQDEDDEELEVDEVLVSVPSGLRLPDLPDGFLDHLQRLPPATGRGALVRIGELCSGRPTGWRETKPLQAFDNVWRAKVGRSYRLLFRVWDGRIEVIDVVHRQDFDKRLQSLR